MAIKRIAGIGLVLLLVTLVFAGAGAAEITSSWSGDTLTFTGESTDTLTQADVADALQKVGHTTPYKVVITGIGGIGGYAFYGDTGLTEITIPDSVTNIGYSAFMSCTGLSSVTFGNGVKSIKGYAFYGCTGLTEITIPDSVTSISSWAFSLCTNLSDIYLGKGVSSISEYTFLYCNSLSSFTVDTNNEWYRSDSSGVLYTKSDTTSSLIRYPAGRTDTSYTVMENVTSIGNFAFYECPNLTSISLPDSVTSIGNYAFRSCTELISVSIPNYVTGIGDYAFSECSKLEHAVIGTSVTNIGDHAFESCSKLAIISLPDSVTSIGNYAFSGCSSITEITIGSGVSSIGIQAFTECKSLTSFTVDSDNQYYKSTDNVLYDKSELTLICYPSGKTTDTYDIVPSVEKIGNYAFEYCPYLKYLSIPATVNSIGDGAFYTCRTLLNIEVKSGNLYYKDIDGVLYSKDGTSIVRYPSGRTSDTYTIPNGVTKISSYAFPYSSYLISISIPATVTSIGDHAFTRCTNLTSITIPDGVTSIGQETFFECTGLNTISMPNVTTIGNYAFYYCTGLNTISMPKVTSIGGHAFYYCTGLNTVTMPKVTSIGTQAFIRCSSLTTVDMRNVLSIDSQAFRNCSGLTTLSMPNVTSIRTQAFSECTSLTSITMPNVTYIEESAFAYCTSLKTITIPGSLTIYDYAFTGCNNLNCVECVSGTPGEEYMDKFGNKSRIVWYLVEDPGTTTYDNRYVVSLDGGALMDDYTQTGYSLPSATDIAVTGKNFVGWYDDNEYTTEHTGDIVAGTMVYAKYDDVKGTDVSLTVGLSYTFTIPASAQLSTVKGNYVYYDVGIQADIREKDNKLVITLNSEPAGTEDEIDYFKVTNTKGDANYQVGKVNAGEFTPIAGKADPQTRSNELISLNMNTEDHVEGYVGFKTITLPSYSGIYTGTLNFLIKEVANGN